MTLVMILALALQDESAVKDALAFLIRHQAPDGSWGARPEGCGCPVPVVPVAREGDVGLLGDDDPGERRAAQERLEASGVAALPLLQEAARSEDRERRGRALASIARIKSSRERGDVELSGLAVLAFLAAGYTHQSRGGGLRHAGAVRGGLRWLVGRQGADGAFDPEDAVADALAAAAVVSVECRTRSMVLGEAALRARVRQERQGIRDGAAFLWIRWIDSSPPRVSALEGPLRWRDCLEEACGTVILQSWAKQSPDPGALFRIQEAAAGRPAPREVYLICGSKLQYTRGFSPVPSWLQSVKEEFGATQVASGCGQGGWEAAGVRRRIENAAYGVMVLSELEWWRRFCRGR